MMSPIYSITLIAICWIIFVGYWIISSFFAKKSVVRNSWKSEKYFIGLLIVVIFVLIIFENSNTDKFLFQSLFSFEIIGVIISVIGLIGAIWSRTILGRNWSGFVTYKEDAELITTGPYNFIRHPIYTSMSLMLLGTSLYYGVLMIFFIFVIMLLRMILRARKEEEIMIDLFGERYIEYMKRTKRFIPLIY